MYCKYTRNACIISRMCIIIFQCFNPNRLVYLSKDSAISRSSVTLRPTHLPIVFQFAVIVLSQEGCLLLKRDAETTPIHFRRKASVCCMSGVPVGLPVISTVNFTTSSFLLSVNDLWIQTPESVKFVPGWSPYILQRSQLTWRYPRLSMNKLCSSCLAVYAWVFWFIPYIFIHLLSLNSLLVRRRSYSCGERYPNAQWGYHSL